MFLRILVFSFIVLSSLYGGSIPSWFLNPPSDGEYLYGTGEGDSLKQARDEALSMLISKLNVSISSQNSKTETQNSYGSQMSYRKDVTQNVKSEVKQVSLNNYDIVSSYVDSGKTYILVKIEKQQFIRDKKNDILQLEKEMLTLSQKVNKLPILERFMGFKEVISLSEKAKTLTLILTTLDSSFSKEAHLSLYDQYKLEYEDIMSAIEAFVSSDKADERFFSDVIKSLLIHEKIKIVKNSQRTKNSILIDVDVAPIVKEIYGRFMAKVKVTVLLKNYQGAIVHNVSLECNGSSSIDKDAALLASAKDFEKKVKEKGIMTFLGLNSSN